MSDNKKLQALIVPLRSMNLIVPHLLVAEIIPFPHVSVVGRLPWFEGVFEWRERTIPLISLDRFCNPEEEGKGTMRSRRVAVLNGIEGIESVTQYGIEISSIPHPVHLGKGEVRSVDGGKPCEMIAASVHAVGVRAVVPDFAALENRVAEALKQAEKAAEA